MNLKLKVEMDIDPEHKPLNLWIAANLYSVAYLFSTATSAIEPTAPNFGPQQSIPTAHPGKQEKTQPKP
jgi:hypothetical protein